MSDEPHIERIGGAFRFKRFTVHQDRCAMKVGTDGVLLGAWTPLRPTDRRLLDIGTGTGLIALMLAQRAPEAEVTGIDIDDVSQARENAAASPWGGRLHFVQTPVQTFAPAGRFDRIVSNPPFFDATLPSPDAGRTTARHTVTLTFSELCDAVLRLLASPQGTTAVVLGSILYKLCIQAALNAGLPANMMKLATAVLFLLVLVVSGRKGEAIIHA